MNPKPRFSPPRVKPPGWAAWSVSLLADAFSWCEVYEPHRPPTLTERRVHGYPQTCEAVINPALPIFVAGHRGLVGSAILRSLEARGCRNFVLATKSELDLTNQAAVCDFFYDRRPAYVFLAAARVGGILANSMFPAEFIRENLAIELNSIEAARRTGIKKFLLLGSSCIYPRLAQQPMKEEYLLSGALEPTNAPYAIAKIAGIALCQAYAKQYGMNCVSLMPTNLYGPGDNFDLNASHVVPALMRKIHDAKENGASEVIVWGGGQALREFLFVDDLGDACVFLMDHYDQAEPINVGTGQDLSIRALASMIARIVGYEGKFTFDSTQPEGTPRKLLDVSKLTALGWTAQTSLEEGLTRTYDWFLANQSSFRGANATVSAAFSGETT